MASVMLGGCGGGSDYSVGGQAATAPDMPPAPTPAAPPPPSPVAPVPPPPATPAPAPAPVLASDIATWGDSLTVFFAVNLQLLYPNRAIYNGGVGGETSTQIATRQLADASVSGHNSWINVFWYGHNNDMASAQIKADIAASVAALVRGNGRFIVLSLINKATPNESRGAPGYASIMQLNSDLAALYPQNYLDVRKALVDQYNPAIPQEVMDFQNDVVPTSFRFDEIHLQNIGSVLVAKKVQEFVNAKGW
jgi:lysophospholipase L1-like esterase